MDDNHIVGLMNEISHAFNHLLTQLALVGLRVKVAKCKLWNPSGFSPGMKIFQDTFWAQMVYTFWVCPWVFKILLCIFWMEFYFRMWHILMIFLSKKTCRLLWAFFPHV
jgi:hypothetical protein